jgi:hypothetical protein
MQKKLVTLFFFTVVLSGLVSSAALGTVPGNIDFGTVEPGETVSTDLYLTVSDFPQDVIRLDPQISSTASLQLDDSGDPDRYAISQEDFSDWISLENSVVNVSSSREVQLENGAVNSDGRVTVVLEVPRDAEPGHHYGQLNLNPGVSTGSGGGSINWGETVPGIHFRVPGNAERQVSARDVRAFRRGQSSALVEVLLVNTGTVTVDTEGFTLDVLDAQGDVETTLPLSGTKLAPDGPNSSEWVQAYWDSGGQIGEGAYEVSGDVNYITGAATASGSFTLPGINRIEVRPEDPDDPSSGGGGVPIWLVVILLSILGVLMWGFDIEPFWILTVLGVLGISAFILLSGISNMLIPVLLIVVGAIVYRGL